MKIKLIPDENFIIDKNRFYLLVSGNFRGTIYKIKLESHEYASCFDFTVKGQTNAESYVWNRSNQQYETIGKHNTWYVDKGINGIWKLYALL